MPPFLLPYPGIVGVHGPHDPASTTTSTGTTTLANYSTTSELIEQLGKLAGAALRRDGQCQIGEGQVGEKDARKRDGVRARKDRQEEDFEAVLR
eukprot:402418-Rhodomonas_salina.2